MFSNIIDYEILSQSGMKFEKKKFQILFKKLMFIVLRTKII
jgi:hypothetical protein